MAKASKRRQETAVVSFESPSKPTIQRRSHGAPQDAHARSKRIMASASLVIVVLAAAAALVSGVLEAASWSSHADRELQTDAATSDAAAFDCDTARAHLTDAQAIKGFHVLCIQFDPTTRFQVHVTAHKDGMFTNQSAEVDVLEFYSNIETMLEIAKPADAKAAMYKQPYAFFSPEGERLESRLSTLANRVVFLFEGGQFIWPGIKIGHKRVVPGLHGIGDVVMETVSMLPLVFAIEEFVTNEEINLILELATPTFAESTISNDRIRDTTARTSSNTWVRSNEHETIPHIDRRTAELIKVPVSHQEAIQVLRYEPTQHYVHHLDLFDMKEYPNNTAVHEKVQWGHRNRLATVFWYMSDVAKGGHTVFPRAGGLPKPAARNDCNVGIKVAPKKRKVILFYSMLPNGETDYMSLHGGCAVEEGTKFSGNKWVWNKPMHYMPEVTAK